MNTIATFDNTVGVLVKAFLEGTLEQTDCAACACGNLVAAAHNRSIARVKNIFRQFDSSGRQIKNLWQNPVWALRDEKDFCPDRFPDDIDEVERTGYTVEDFAKIEAAFMLIDTDLKQDEFHLNGLMAVVDVLAEIHGIDLTTATAAKALFVKA